METLPDTKQHNWCASCDECPLLKAEQEGAEFAGSRFILVSLLLFIMPLLLAIAGAMVFSGTNDSRFLGALAGLAMGITCAVFVFNRFYKTRKVEK